MKHYYLIPICCALMACGELQDNNSSAVITLTEETLMHEVRATPQPLDGAHVGVNPPRFMWPDNFPHLGAVLDGEPDTEKPQVLYRIRISQDKDFKKGVIQGEQPWAFFNPFQVLKQGKWYWQYAYVTPEGTEIWSQVLHFYIDRHTPVFNPPSFDQALAQVLDPDNTAPHPRILLSAADWEDVISRNLSNPEAQAYLTRSQRILATPLKHLKDEIDTTHVVLLTNKVQRKASLIRESRKIVDREERNVETLVRAYLLTKDTTYAYEAINRLTAMLSWQTSPYLAGDFNKSTLLSLCTSVYDGCYQVLSPTHRQLLLQNIRTIGGQFYHEYVNHLENRIADNHVWQMTFRILTMAAFATLDENPEAVLWARYCYNQWISRFPGLNDDGAWHNGDSYFHVNIRTLIEIPAFYSRLTGFNFFADNWYTNNALYVIYQQPPFSKSGGHGNSHDAQLTPTGARVGYADAIARECQDPWATAYVHEILQEDPHILSKAFEAKPSDLTWYRCTTTKQRPPYTKTLADLPPVKVFPHTGTALMHTNIGDHNQNAMLSFRSSPYGSTSHALANQNAFNTFYGGHAIFYSTGHRTSFIDDHSLYAYRNTRAHNTIMVDGMGQKIGTEGYGWIPRYYEGSHISYVVGDASNAYGQVTSPLWLERGRLSGIQYTPQNGWDQNQLTGFRRHIVQLDTTGLYIVYDQLEAQSPVSWHYLLHTIEKPMEIAEAAQAAKALTITGRNRAGGTAVAHLFASQPMTYTQVDTFFVPAIDWIKRLNGPIPNHYHFTARTTPSTQACFLNVVDVHGNNRNNLQVTQEGDRITVAGWVITCNLSTPQTPYLHIENPQIGVSLDFNSQNNGLTTIVDKVKGQSVTRILTDSLPELEI